MLYWLPVIFQGLLTVRVQSRKTLSKIVSFVVLCSISAPDDYVYVERFFNLTFNSGVNRLCAIMIIEEDPAFEGIETFGVTITTLDEDTILNPDNVRVVIVDTDG